VSDATPVRVDLTVTAIKGKTLDITTYGGPPTVILGSWVTVTATNGEISVTEEVRINDAPAIGSTWPVYRAAPKAPDA
jgi:hypothetical protein